MKYIFSKRGQVVLLNGTPVWRWRPRETCVDGGFECFNTNLAFGAVPNLFSINVNGEFRDVVGVGNKDGTYKVFAEDLTEPIKNNRTLEQF